MLYYSRAIVVIAVVILLFSTLSNSFASQVSENEPSVVIHDTVITPGELLLQVDALNFTGDNGQIAAITLRIEIDTFLIQFISIQNVSLAGSWLANYNTYQNEISITYIASPGTGSDNNGKLLDMHLKYFGGFPANLNFKAYCEIANSNLQNIDGVIYEDGLLNQTSAQGTIKQDSVGVLFYESFAMPVTAEGTGYDMVNQINLRVGFDTNQLEYEGFIESVLTDVVVTESNSVLTIEWIDDESFIDFTTLDTLLFLKFKYISDISTSTYLLPGSKVTNNDDLVASDFFNGLVREIWLVEVINNPDVAGIIIGGGYYFQGDEVTLTAIPEEGYNFLNWIEGGSVISSDSIYEFVMPDNSIEFTAVYEIVNPQVTATVDLSAGWTWFSLNVNDGDMSLDNVLSSLSLSENDYIKNQTSSATYYEGYGWYGALTEIDPTQMYQISLAGSDVLEYTGMAVDPTSNPINLNAGWTWIGYLPQVDLDINVALASLSLDENDYIKNQTGSATYYDGYGWYGALETLSLYDGYKISLSNADVLTYPTTTMKSAPQSELPIFANNTGITVNPYKYEFNGTVTARVFNNNVLSKSEDDMLLAYVGDECRGISRAMYFEPTDEFAYQLMIYSNIVEGETVMFKYFDSQSNELYECVETIQFTNDMVMADAFNTLDLNTKSTLGINTTIDYAAFNVYPNPSRGITTIDYTLKNTSEVLIVISDIYGKQIKVIENQIKDAGNYSTEWNAEINESGTYFIKIVSNNSIQMRKVVLMK